MDIVQGIQIWVSNVLNLVIGRMTGCVSRLEFSIYFHFGHFRFLYAALDKLSSFFIAVIIIITHMQANPKVIA